MKLELRQLVLPLAAFRLEVDRVLTAPVTGLTGSSGSGKTSLLEIIAGLRRPAAGRVIFEDQILTDGADGKSLPPWRREIGYVPQDQALFPHLSVERNLLYACQVGGRKADADLKNRIVDMLEIAPLLARGIADLSGGERGRVALGRALMSRPRLLLLDEPLAHLDDRLRARALDYLKAAAGEFRLPMIFVSHSAAELRAICGEVLHMERGRLVPADGSEGSDG
ncbi:MAG: ATP-binding cassette domain-containing protein [Verrucomicrobiota bacterium]